MRQLVDLHTHSTASDGTLSPAEVVALAGGRKLCALALTDHDTVAGLAAGAEAAEGLELRFVPGVEISAQFPRGMLHILGLGIDPANATLAHTLEELRQARRQRNPRILEKLAAMGMPITMTELIGSTGIRPVGVPPVSKDTVTTAGTAVLPKNTAGTAVPPQNTAGTAVLPKNTAGTAVPPESQQELPVLGRLHIARLMVRKGYVRDVPEAFERYLAKDRPAYEEKEHLLPAEVISAIHSAGGVAMLAHPSHLKYENSAQLEVMVRSLTAAGLDGIEAYHSDHTPVQTRLHLDLARRLNLLVSGGSDFHGLAKPQSIGSPSVPLAAVQQLLERIAR